jgi:hypothetical protein
VTQPRAYRHSGLRIRSELPLTGLVEVDETGADPDVVISVTPGSAVAADTIVVEDARVRFTLAGVGAFEIRDGREICVAPADAAQPRTVAAMVLAPAWGVLLHQRGDLALHGAAVAADDGAIAFCGPSGAGKSSTAAWLVTHGCRVISDDVCRVALRSDNVPYVWRSTPRLKLTDEAIRHSGWRVDEEQREPSDGKHNVPVAGYEGREPLPLRAVYLLDWGEYEMQRLQGTAGLWQFRADAIYRPDLVPAARLAPHWQTCVEVVRKVPLWELRRPRCWAELGSVMTDLVTSGGWPGG